MGTKVSPFRLPIMLRPFWPHSMLFDGPDGLSWFASGPEADNGHRINGHVVMVRSQLDLHGTHQQNAYRRYPALERSHAIQEKVPKLHSTGCDSFVTDRSSLGCVLGVQLFVGVLPTSSETRQQKDLLETILANRCLHGVSKEVASRRRASSNHCMWETPKRCCTAITSTSVTVATYWERGGHEKF